MTANRKKQSRQRVSVGDVVHCIWNDAHSRSEWLTETSAALSSDCTTHSWGRLIALDATKAVIAPTYCAANALVADCITIPRGMIQHLTRLARSPQA